MVIHPYVIGELALGHLQPRAQIISEFTDLPRTAMATDLEVLHMIEAENIIGAGIGYVDAQLLAALRLAAGALLWTKDARQRRVAETMNLHWSEA